MPKKSKKATELDIKQLLSALINIEDEALKNEKQGRIELERWNTDQMRYDLEDDGIVQVKKEIEIEEDKIKLSGLKRISFWVKPLLVITGVMFILSVSVFVFHLFPCSECSKWLSTAELSMVGMVAAGSALGFRDLLGLPKYKIGISD